MLLPLSIYSIHFCVCCMEKNVMQSVVCECWIGVVLFSDCEYDCIFAYRLEEQHVSKNFIKLSVHMTVKNFDLT